jgi:hypothetical protein
MYTPFAYAPQPLKTGTHYKKNLSVKVIRSPIMRDYAAAVCVHLMASNFWFMLIKRPVLFSVEIWERVSLIKLLLLWHSIFYVWMNNKGAI